MKKKNNSFDELREGLAHMSPIGAVVEGGENVENNESCLLNVNAIPVLPLRGIVPFQFITMPLPVGRQSSLAVCEEGVRNNRAILALAQKDPSHEDPFSAEMYDIGVVCRVIKVLQMPDGNHTAFLVCGHRASVSEVRVFQDKYVEASIQLLPDSLPKSFDNEELNALMASIFEKFEDILELAGPENTAELRFTLEQMDTPVKELNFISANAPIELDEKQKMLATTDFKKRTTTAR